MPDPVALLTDDHRQVEDLLERLEEAEGPERAELLEQLETSLRLHMKSEERLGYPLVAEAVGTEEAEEAEVEHGLVRDGLAKARELLDAPGFGAVVQMIKGGIEHHVQEEEGEIFPQLVDQLDEERRAALGDAVAEAKAAGDVSVDATVEVTSGTEGETEVDSGDRADRTKQELLEEARERDIPGRSQMSKDELQQALEQS